MLPKAPSTKLIEGYSWTSRKHLSKLKMRSLLLLTTYPPSEAAKMSWTCLERKETTGLGQNQMQKSVGGRNYDLTNGTYWQVQYVGPAVLLLTGQTPPCLHTVIDTVREYKWVAVTLSRWGSVTISRNQFSSSSGILIEYFRQGFRTYCRLPCRVFKASLHALFA